MCKNVFICLAAVLMACAGVTAAGLCGAARGEHVTLFGGVDDPDVLVWDSRARLVRYASEVAGEKRVPLRHALLVRPGTRAVVLECIPHAVHPAFHTGVTDAVGVQIRSGAQRGRYGWVSSEDLRGARIPDRVDPW